jgi:ribonucleoside-diphosphate reductase alpha chain
MYREEAVKFLQNKKYLEDGETIEQRIDGICSVIARHELSYNEPGLAERIKGYINDQILVPSTPQWSNVGRSYKGSANLPASCYILGVENSIQGIYKSFGETAMMSKLGGGIGSSYINVVDKGTKLEEGFYSNSKLDWIEDGLRSSQKVSQGAVRRGYSVPSILITDVEYYDFIERLDKKNPDAKDPLVRNTGCIVLPKTFWEDFETDPELKKRFLLLIQKRKSKGKIYILDIANCNINHSEVYSKLEMEVNATNICTEALTALDPRYSFVCMLASQNLMKYDVIKKDPQITKDCFMFLDIMVTEFIDLTEGIPFMEKARRSAIEKRDIGLGTMGLTDLFRSKGYAFGDLDSRRLNKEIYKFMRDCGEEYTREAAEILGSPQLCVDAGMVRRNVSLMMIAPNKSTSFLPGETQGVSQGIQSRVSNYYSQELAGFEAVVKDQFLMEELEAIGKNTEETWDQILSNNGSVQKLDFLSEKQKAVFKTASEVSPKDLIDLAADRQVHIDMAQSLNLFGRPQYTTKDVYDIHRYAFSKGIKTLYYYFAQGHASIEVDDGSIWSECESCAD